MRSIDLAHLRFSGWSPFCRAYKSLVLDNLPEKPGVYAVRSASAVPEVGSSDLIYVGSATNRDGLRLRVRQYYHPGPTQTTNRRIRDLVMDSENYGLSYIVAPTNKRAVAWEMAILNRFVSEHRALPPQNRRLVAMIESDVEAAFVEMAETEVDWPGGYVEETCYKCGLRSRVALDGGNDPFYNEPYVYADSGGVFVCRRPDCDDQ